VTAVRLRSCGESFNFDFFFLIPGGRVAFVRILIESGEVRPPIDDLEDLPGGEGLVKFERAV
jgi:hypothetical protein